MSEAMQSTPSDEELDNFPDDLTLQWRYAKALGFEVIGNEGEHFAMRGASGAVCFIGTPETPVPTSYFLTNIPQEILGKLQSLNGVLLSNDSQGVTCKIGSTIAIGPDFLRAAMLGVAKFKGK